MGISKEGTRLKWYNENMNKIKIEQKGAMGLWIAGWLFTIGFLHLAFWKGVLAILLWPYYLGVMLRAFWN
jgi:hypothetical protein